MIIIEVAETAERHGMFQAMLDGNIIVASSVTPFLDAARVLLAQGVDSDELLVMRHHSVDSLRAKIGTAAKLESQAMVSDSDLRPIGPKRHWCVETVAGLSDTGARRKTNQRLSCAAAVTFGTGKPAAFMVEHSGRADRRTGRGRRATPR